MKTILLTIWIASCFFGCTTALDPGPVTHYPLTKDNAWSYNASASLTNFRPARAGITFRDTTVTWTSHVRAEGPDTLLDSIITWKCTSRDSGLENSQGVQHYLVHGDTLLLFAYYNPSLALPKRGHGYSFVLGGTYYNSIDDIIKILASEMKSIDTLFVELHPPAVLIFPLTIEKEWKYRDVPFRINKKIIGTENVNTPAGDFACYKIQWFWDLNADGRADSLITGLDYINSRGLIKRTIEVRNIVVVSAPGSEDPLGYIDLKNEYSVRALTGSLYPSTINKAK